VSSVEKFDRLAGDWSEREYGDPEAFALERSGPLARLVLRRYGSFFCAAS
jgi:hypothetical protein